MKNQWDNAVTIEESATVEFLDQACNDYFDINIGAMKSLDRDQSTLTP
ncbi:MAG: hypothetical protein GY806_01350 [Gammaproteobacteria bacterium]|nr:hypothetical protein [Gammaproteobacteria bacterium]